MSKYCSLWVSETPINELSTDKRNTRPVKPHAYPSGHTKAVKKFYRRNNIKPPEGMR